jgi:hypothetical protein
MGAKKYWALVGRIPDGENMAWTSATPVTRREALRAFEQWLQEQNGLTATDMEDNRVGYGTAWLLDGALSSDSPIKSHREI